MPDLLIELFSEEIPARMQARARDDLRRLVTDGLVEAGLTYAGAAAFSTPRRLTLTVQGLTAESPTLREERKGPKADGPAAAIEGFLRSTGLSREQLVERDTGKGAVLFALVEKPGRKAPDIVAEVLTRTIRDFPWPKSMRWGSGSLRWVRPLHSILCLLTTEAGAAIVPLDIDGIPSGNTTQGHRFMAPVRFSVTSFDDYAAKLKRAHVLLDPAERAALIWNDATNAAFAAGLEVVEDAALLAEVAGLVEWPVVLMGPIAERFLTLPPEVLQTSMREHQKFFSVRNPATGRIERFITVANRDTADGGATILHGNGKVLAARLSDARFFWDTDLHEIRKSGLEGMGAGLANVTFHNKLGSQADRVARIAALAREIAPLVGADPALAEQAARVAKSDLRSAMVGEFPELQGLMGRYYATEAGLPVEVAEACELHYKPLGPTDSVPTAPVSVAVALADKIDTLTGFWAIDEKPTGSKDPFALRRAALGVIRLVLGNGVRVGLRGVMIAAAARVPFETFVNVDSGKLYPSGVPQELTQKVFTVGELMKAREQGQEVFVRFGMSNNQNDRLVSEALREHYPALVRDALTPVALDLLSFFDDRLKVHLKDEGIRHDVIDAVLAPAGGAPSGATSGNDDLTLVVTRARALQAVLKTDDGENLLQGFRRAANILTQAEEKDGVEYSFGPDPKFADHPAETALFQALDAAEATIAPAMAREDFPAAMQAMAALRAPIDAFFEAVQINTENQTLRRNRLNLLHRIRATCLAVADLTRLEG
jgi:glycyl-tRNA synthetase beta chain